MYSAEQDTPSISIRQLGKQASECIRDVEGGEPVMVLRENQPAAYIVPLEAAAKLGLNPPQS
jgi:antitoxin (DNA-binding transcriptional repressor) of toxin-antitoxin stability system